MPDLSAYQTLIALRRACDTWIPTWPTGSNAWMPLAFQEGPVFAPSRADIAVHGARPILPCYDWRFSVIFPIIGDGMEQGGLDVHRIGAEGLILMLVVPDQRGGWVRFPLASTPRFGVAPTITEADVVLSDSHLEIITSAYVHALLALTAARWLGDEVELEFGDKGV